jgi:hypothetical protein
MPDDASADQLEELGEWLHGRLMEQFGLETENWAVERAGRAARALNSHRKHFRPLRAEILWTQEMTAFTAPGSYIYVSREILQRTATDDPAAFVIAHEMAHHDLGHTDLFAGRLGPLRRIPGGILPAAVLRIAQGYLDSPEREAEADAYALDLCLDAGYTGRECIAAFDILEAYCIDHGDLDMVFGPDEMLVEQEQGVRRLLNSAATWKWQHARGYMPIRNRKAALAGRMDALGRA